MTATFDPTLPAPLDRIRQRIGDTDTANAQVQDETITAYLETPMSELQAVYRLFMDLAGKWARYATTTVDDQQQRAEDVYKHYLQMAKEVKLEIGGTSAAADSLGAIFVGGLDDTRGPIDPDCVAYPFLTGSATRGP